MISSPEDVVNIALTRAGWKVRVQSLFEGSMAADAMLNLYGQTRDDLLREGEWDFAKRSSGLMLLKAAPPGGYVPPNVWTTAFPPPPWLYEYNYPPDALKIDAIRPAPFFNMDMDPQPIVFRVSNDASTAGQVVSGFPNQLTIGKVILCNLPNPIVTYTGRVTDPTVWDASFTEALCAALAERAAEVLKEAGVAKKEAADEAQADTEAMSRQG